PRQVELDLRGAPIPAAILGEGARNWSCCDTACLTGDDAVSSPVSCTANSEYVLSASGEFTVPEPAKWDDSCMELHGADDEGTVRVTYPAVGTCMGGPCKILLSPGPVGGDGQDYRLRIEPQVGSLFRSTNLDLRVGAGALVEPIQLDYRVMLYGDVSVAGCSKSNSDGIDCSPPAEVVAERIIRDEDPATLVGPYYYTTSISSPTGKYVLPLNPGVYLLTALPKVNASGGQTGPAPIQVID